MTGRSVAAPATAKPTAALFCAIPAVLEPKLMATLRRELAGERIEVIVERRTRERRSHERRSRLDAVPADRRRVHADDGRRVAERRAVTVHVSAPPLPRRVQRHGAQIVFFERVEPARERTDDAEVARIVTRFQLGDQSAFGDLYQRYFDPVYGYLRVMVRDYHEAEDITQQTFTKVFRALPSYERRAGTPFRAWLFRIARNEAYSHLRRHGRLEVEDPAQLDGRRDEDAGPMAVTSLDWLSDSELMLFVERLPVAQRQVLMLRYMIGLRADEVATVMERTPQAIRKLEHRALRFLRERLSAMRDKRELRMERAGMLMRVRRAPVLTPRRYALAMTRHRERRW